MLLNAAAVTASHPNSVQVMCISGTQRMSDVFYMSVGATIHQVKMLKSKIAFCVTEAAPHRAMAWSICACNIHGQKVHYNEQILCCKQMKNAVRSYNPEQINPTYLSMSELGKDHSTSMQSRSP